MCVHKRESNRKMSQAHDKINKERAAERRGVVTGHSKEVRDSLFQSGLVNRQPGRRVTAN